MTARDSPARTLVFEQKPSTQGQRYREPGATLVLESIQSTVPGFSFSARMRSGFLGLGPAAADASRETIAPSAVPAVAFNRLRRVMSSRSGITVLT